MLPAYALDMQLDKQPQNKPTKRIDGSCLKKNIVVESTNLIKLTFEGNTLFNIGLAAINSEYSQ